MDRAAGRPAPAPDALLNVDSITWRTRTPLRYLGGVRAVLLQLARPEIADAVAASGRFETDPLGRVAATIGVVGVIRHGSAVEARAAVRHLWALHATIGGRLADGRSYRATEPDLWWWVLATMFDSARAVDRAYVRSLDRDDERQLYREHLLVADALGIDPAVVPVDLDAFDAFVGEQYATLEVTRTARHVGDRLLGLELPVPAPSAARRLVRSVTADLMPARVAGQYGLAVGPVTGAATSAAQRILRPVLRALHRHKGRIPGRPGLRLERAITTRVAPASAP